MHFNNQEEKINYLKKANLHVFKNPYRLKIEASYGCNRVCKFCAVPYNVRPKKDNSHISYMTLDTYKKIIESSPTTLKRIEFIMHGEPTYNNNLIDFFKITKEKLKNTQITLSTNGDRFIKNNPSFDTLVDLFNAGGNQIQLSIYDEKAKENFEYLLKHEKEKLLTIDVKIQDLYGGHYWEDVKNIYHFKTAKDRILVFYDESKGLNSGDLTVRKFHSWGGAVLEHMWKKQTREEKVFTKMPKMTQCVPLLKYITFGWNGDYLLCCRDVARSISLGNIQNTPIDKFWNSHIVNAYRLLLKLKRRDAIAPCVLCNRRGYRDGLYAYWPLEKFSMDELLAIVKNTTDLKYNQLYKNLNKYFNEYKNIDDFPISVKEPFLKAKKKFGDK